ncbi:DUF255 domain-containing protein [Shewanella maritima]|uniref:DUF255 domain-containing protein n=1 Tax=Shewanella maritima TaxID=2520507 RepID=UPI003735A218
MASFESQKQWLFDNQVIHKLQTTPEFINALIDSGSPYLLSHALQPIDWIEWNEQFKQGVADKSKLVFISIGYSTCHWCHVMAEESFNDPAVAELLNESYISVKVDREQWPLVDNRFKSALEAIKGEAGWPINAILTPDGQLIWIESYLDKQAFSKVLVGLAKRWQSKPSAVNVLAKRVEQKLLLDKPPILKGNSVTLSTKQWRQVLPSLHEDIVNGLQKEQGTDGPRFFRAYWLLGLLDEYLRSSDITILRQVQNHVDLILKSPTYDAIEGGFHRYAVDEQWQEPHYEKMLYTQANMIRVLAKLYAITGQQRYRIALMQTVNWSERWLRQTQGMGSAVSALSDGVEGLYYQHLANEYSQIDFSKDWPNSTIVRQLAGSRERRVKPLVDEKVILSWNSLYIVALLEAYQVTRQAELLESATELSNQLWESLVDGETVYRSLFAGRAAINAEMEDLAWFALSQMMLSFYEPFSISKMIATYSELSDSQAKYRNFILLGKLADKLQQPILLRELLNLNHDGELPSARSTVYSALSLGYSLSQNRHYRQLSKTASALSDTWARQLVNEYSFVAHNANSLHNTNINQASFARGKGRVSASKSFGKITLQFDMADGWHINANDIKNERLIATKVESDLVDSRVTYPKSINKKLGFDDGMLQLYEGKFELYLDIEAKDGYRHKVNISLQACSDQLCLLPENIKLYMFL